MIVMTMAAIHDDKKPDMMLAVGLTPEDIGHLLAGDDISKPVENEQNPVSIRLNLTFGATDKQLDERFRKLVSEITGQDATVGDVFEMSASDLKKSQH